MGADLELIDAGREQLAAELHGALDCLRQAAVGRWAFGVHLRKIQRLKLWRFDGEVEATSFDDWLDRALHWSRATVYRAMELADAYDQATLRATDLAPSALLAIVGQTKGLPPAERAAKRRQVVEQLTGTGASAADAARAASDGEDEPDAPPPSVRLPPVAGDSVWVEAELPTQPEATYYSNAGRPVRRPRVGADGELLLGGMVLRIALCEGYAVEVELGRAPVARLTER